MVETAEGDRGGAGRKQWSEPVIHVEEKGAGESGGRLLVELPGVRKGDVRLVLVEGRVDIEARGGFRDFKASIELPAWLAPPGEAGIQASMDDGLLIIGLSEDAGAPADPEGEQAATADGKADIPPSKPGAGAEGTKDGPCGNGSGSKQEAPESARPPTIPIDDAAAGGGPTELGEMESLRDQLLRLRADFDNFRKRSRKEKEDYAQRRITDILLGVLDVMDALDRGVDTSAQCKDPDKLSRGLELIQQQARSVLQSMNVSPVDPAGTAFDPNLHEAVESVKDGKKEEGAVESTLAKGYVYGDILLRPARVRVIRNG